MFIQGFDFVKINSQVRHSKGVSFPFSFKEHNFSFRDKTGKRYVVIVEEFEYYVFAVKFCLQDHKNYSDKFNRLTKLNQCSRILTTMGNIMKNIYANNPYASFGFKGSPSLGESENNTKRFKLYSNVIEQLISPVDFEHRSITSISAYLMLNRQNPETDLLNKIEIMFKNNGQL